MQIRISKSAIAAVARSNKRDMIRQKIAELAAEPHSMSANIVRLKGRPHSRLRIQDWRVIFRIENGILFIDEVGPRGSIYED